MTRYLITPSLYASWLWSHDAPDDKTEDARKELVAYLRRDPVPPNEAILQGRKFEDDVRRAAEGQGLLPFVEINGGNSKDSDPKYEAAVNEIADIVRGGLWQEKIYVDMKFSNHGNILLFGRVDVTNGPWLFDIKWTKNYKIGKYSKGIQHTAYMIGMESKNFAYLPSDGKSVYREDYFYSFDSYKELRGRLVEMLDDIKRDKELAALYAEHWQADRRVT